MLVPGAPSPLREAAPPTAAQRPQNEPPARVTTQSTVSLEVLFKLVEETLLVQLRTGLWCETTEDRRVIINLFEPFNVRGMRHRQVRVTQHGGRGFVFHFPGEEGRHSAPERVRRNQVGVVDSSSV